MLRDLLSSRWFQGGFAFFVLCVGGSLLYSWHVHRTTEAEFGKRPQPVVSIENRSPETNTAPVDFQTEGVVDTPDENTETPMSDETEALPNETENPDFVDAFLPDDFVSEEAPTEDVPVSPYGFGAYPEVPDGFPDQFLPVWRWSEEKRRDFSGSFRNMELIHRVLIKLWNQGDRDWRGANFDEENGRVYPLYRDRIYVTRWIEVPVEGGKVVPFPAGGTSGGSGFRPDIESFVKSGGNLPSHIQFIDRDTAGYNPREFLNLK